MDQALEKEVDRFCDDLAKNAKNSEDILQAGLHFFNHARMQTIIHAQFLIFAHVRFVSLLRRPNGLPEAQLRRMMRRQTLTR
jgi:hypothetical protein